MADRHGHRGYFNMWDLTLLKYSCSSTLIKILCIAGFYVLVFRIFLSFFLLAQSDNIGGTGYIILVASRNATLSYVAVYLAAWWIASFLSSGPRTNGLLSGIYPVIRKSRCVMHCEFPDWCPGPFQANTMYTTYQLTSVFADVFYQCLGLEQCRGVIQTQRVVGNGYLIVSVLCINTNILLWLHHSCNSGNINGAVSSNVVSNLFVFWRSTLIVRF